MIGASVKRACIALLMTDLVGSTRLWQADPEAMHEAMVAHDKLIQMVVRRHGGRVLKLHGGGDSALASFPDGKGATAAACELQKVFDRYAWPTPAPLRLRIGVHVGEVVVRGGDIHGLEVNRCARIRDRADAGQVLASASTVSGIRLLEGRDLGRVHLRDFDEPVRLFALHGTGRAYPAVERQVAGEPDHVAPQVPVGAAV